jgi:hypothetical protein
VRPRPDTRHLPAVALPDSLALRHVTPADGDALVDLLSTVHAGPDGTPAESVGVWQRDLLERGHPTAGPTEMMVVEDRRTGALASCLMMVPQTWCYSDVPFEVGRLELAATHPAYRGNGLTGHLLRVLSDESAFRGELMQAMTDALPLSGDFGYQAVMTQRAGRGGQTSALPSAPATGEPVRLRRAVVSDIPLLLRVDNWMRQRLLLSCLRDEAQWKHELTGRSHGSMVRDEILVVDSPAGAVGYVVLGYGGIPSFPIPDWLPGLPCPEAVVSIAGFELLPGIPWYEVTPSVLRQLTGADSQGEEGYLLWLGLDHPAYDVLSDLLVRRPPHIGWYLRVPNMSLFLRQIAPVLERRLLGTAGDAFTGDLLLHFDTYGIRLSLKAGALVEVGPWVGSNRRGSDASLPEQMFLQLVLGHAEWEDIAAAFPDCRLQSRKARLLLPLLFPKQRSHIWPLT